MKSICFGLILSFCTVLTLTPALAAKTPRQVVDEIFVKVSRSEISKNNKLQHEVTKNFDFQHMGKSVLGARFSKLSKSERVWFVRTLKRIITESIYPNALDFFAGVKTTYEKTKTKKGIASLTSVLEKKGEETDVAYRFHKVSGSWLLIDVEIDDESWIEGIKEEVQDVLQKEKWSGLKKRLNRRLAKLKKKS